MLKRQQLCPPFGSQPFDTMEAKELGFSPGFSCWGEKVGTLQERLKPRQRWAGPHSDQDCSCIALFKLKLPVGILKINGGGEVWFEPFFNF